MVRPESFQNGTEPLLEKRHKLLLLRGVQMSVLRQTSPQYYQAIKDVSEQGMGKAVASLSLKDHFYPLSLKLNLITYKMGI